MTKTPKNPKLPLTQSSRSAFEKRYAELYLKDAEDGISDENLMNAVNNFEAPAPAPSSAPAPAPAPEKTEEGLAALNNEYFELFGAKPLQSMTPEQIENEIKLKNLQIEEANAKKPAKSVPAYALKDDESFAENAAGERRIFKKQTLKYLPEWKVVADAPKELKK